METLRNSNHKKGTFFNNVRFYELMEKAEMLRAKRQKYVIIKVSFEFKLDRV